MTDTIASRWAHPNVILVATSLSDLDQLMPVAFGQARETGARLILFHAVSSATALSADAIGVPYYHSGNAANIAEHMLLPWCQRAQSLNLSCQSAVREGNPAEQILVAARLFHADRILLGTRSRGRMSKMLLGSVAEQVLRSANLPVVTVGPEAHLPVASDAQSVVLYATTLRETSHPSAALAYAIARGSYAKLVALHVVPPAEEMTHKGLAIGLDSVATRELKVLAGQIDVNHSSEIETGVLHGDPATEILADAAARHAILIVLGAEHRSAFENITRESTVYRVLAHARCPVLTLLEPSEKTESAGAEQSTVLQG